LKKEDKEKPEWKDLIEVKFMLMIQMFLLKKEDGINSQFLA
jgi:hypothetical protein